MYTNPDVQAAFSNESLRRVRRFTTFIAPSNVSRCGLNEEFNTNVSELCAYVKRTPSCSFHVFIFDYLVFTFCHLKIYWSPLMMFPAALIMMMEILLLYLITKYFFIPNYVGLMNHLPISNYAYCFSTFGFWIVFLKMLRNWINCTSFNNSLASLWYSNLSGDILYAFTVGVLCLCLKGYHVDGIRFWGNMTFILLGMGFLYDSIYIRYALFKRADLPSSCHYMLTQRALFFICILGYGMGFTVLVSYATLKQSKQDLVPTSYKLSLWKIFNAHPPKEQHMHSQEYGTIELSSLQVWERTVNPLYYMQNEPKLLQIMLAPFFFVAANIIPVIDKSRVQNGWCKPVVCLSFIVFPFMAIAFHPEKSTWLSMFIACVLTSLTIFVITQPLSRPYYLYGFSFLGLFMSTHFILCCDTEMDNLIWQYTSMRFDDGYEMIPVVFFGYGEVQFLVIVMQHFIQRNMRSAAFGVLMSMTTYQVYTTLAVIVLHDCYDSSTFVTPNAYTETCDIFSLIIYVVVLFHVSMCGFEFRTSLLYQLLLFLVVYLTYQMMCAQRWIHPLGQYHTDISPEKLPHFWA